MVVSKHNVARHYDLRRTTLRFSRLPTNSTSRRQLLIKGGDRVLDIGSGWGGLGLYLAEMTGAAVKQYT